MIEATFSLCDPLNPGCGYQLRITDGPRSLLFTSVAPDDGSDLKTAADCVRVINMYLPAPTQRETPVFKTAAAHGWPTNAQRYRE